MIFELRYNGGEKALLRGEVCEELKESIPKSHTLVTWCQKSTPWKRPWCWERLRAGGEEGNRGWDGWMASSTWVSGNSGRQWRTGKPGVPQSMGSQSVVQWATKKFHSWFGSSLSWPSLFQQRLPLEWTLFSSNTAPLQKKFDSYLLLGLGFEP